MLNTNDPFAEVAPYYSGRARYAPELFHRIAQWLPLGAGSNVLDLCCGQGELATGFSPYVGQVVAVDRSEEMLTRARSSAPGNVTYLNADLALDNDEQSFGCFSLVTIGRALGYIPREPALKLLERSLSPGGAVFVGRAVIGRRTNWRDEYQRVKRNYGFLPRTTEEKEFRYFENSPFERVAQAVFEEQTTYDIDRLVMDSLSFPSLVEGAKNHLSAFRQDLKEALAKYKNAEGLLPTTVRSGGFLVRKREDRDGALQQMSASTQDATVCGFG
jgi:ubiquinone/menaquinone biosynthesis C-methylase UbiE